MMITTLIPVELSLFVILSKSFYISFTFLKIVKFGGLFEHDKHPETITHSENIPISQGLHIKPPYPGKHSLNLIALK